MKAWILLLVAFAGLLACNKEDAQPDPQPDPCLEYISNPAWTKEVFHGGIFIQFPDEYMGGITGFEGPIFTKYRTEPLVYMWYAFCEPLFCHDYGQSLLNPDTTFVKVRTFGFSFDSITLTRRREICDDQVILGIYFYKDSIRSIGKLYWYTDHVFKEALTIEFDSIKKDEVYQILQTIHK